MLSRRVVWAPDGTSLLASYEPEHAVRVLEVPSLGAAVSVRVPEAVDDLAWYPASVSAQPATCCFATCARDVPVQLWDAWRGSLRATYAPLDADASVAPSHSLAFAPDGQRLYAASVRCINVFDVARPGRGAAASFSLRPCRRSRAGQGGRVAALAAAPPGKANVLAAGSYQGSVCVYDARAGKLTSRLPASGENGADSERGGVTQLAWTPDASCVIAARRRDPRMDVWDVRMGARAMATFHRAAASTTQRLGFAVEPERGRFILSGGTDGGVYCYDLLGSCKDTLVHRADYCVADVTWHPSYPCVALSLGQRAPAGAHLVCSSDDDDDDGGAGDGGSVRHTVVKGGQVCGRHAPDDPARLVRVLEHPDALTALLAN